MKFFGPWPCATGCVVALLSQSPTRSPVSGVSRTHECFNPKPSASATLQENFLQLAVDYLVVPTCDYLIPKPMVQRA